MDVEKIELEGFISDIRSSYYRDTGAHFINIELARTPIEIKNNYGELDYEIEVVEDG